MPPSGILGDGKGLLEIKCPFKLRDSQPWQVPPAYYMPQVRLHKPHTVCSYNQRLHKASCNACIAEDSTCVSGPRPVT